MTVYFENIPPLRHENLEEQIKQLQHAVVEKTRKLEEVNSERLRTEEAHVECTEELKRRVALVVETGGVADALRELGQLLQHESQLSEQLNPQVSTVREQSKSRTRNPSNEMERMEKRLTEKETSLNTQLLEAKRVIAETRVRRLNAEALVEQSTSKPQRKQRIKNRLLL